MGVEAVVNVRHLALCAILGPSGDDWIARANGTGPAIASLGLQVGDILFD